MARRRRHPRNHRFLGFLGVPAACGGVLLVTRLAQAPICKMLKSASTAATCPEFEFPLTVRLILWAGIIGGVALSAFQWYRDFVLHDHLNEDR